MDNLNARHFDSLNARQLEAVTHRDGPLLVIAGAGTGKTRVITHRIAHLISQGIKPNEILAVTFTNKAAAEMRDRVGKLLASEVRPPTNGGLTSGNVSDFDIRASSLPFVGTFHSLGVHILRESGRAVGVGRWFAILDRDESKKIVRNALKESGYDPKQFEPGGILSAISRAKGDMISRADYTSEQGSSFYGEVVAKVWEKYERELAKQEALDFDDLLVKTVELLRDYENVRKRYQSTWRYIHVDEYQDTNKVQYEIIKLLAGDHANVCAVGDHDQLIYAWRGASIENLMGFEKDFPGSKVVLLEENYRSTSNILDAANSVIAKNEERKEKNLFTSLGKGEKIVLHEAFDPGDEAHFVVQTVKELLTKGRPLDSKGLPFVLPENIAVLYRANFQSRSLEEAFLNANLPYTVMGTRFYERIEVKDILAYVKCALNRNDRVSFERAVASPRRGIGDKSLENYFNSGTTSEKISSFVNLLDNFKNKLESMSLPDALRYIAKNSGYEDMLKKSEEQERLENIQELINLSNKYKGLPNQEALEKFLTDASLASDQDTLLLEDEKAKSAESGSPGLAKARLRGVRLSTVHAAKGLEFEHVFIVGLEQDLFPHKPMDDLSTDSRQAISRNEEERRLFYVALTRAKKCVYLSWCQTRSIYGNSLVQMKSEFLSDIPNELIESASEVEPLESFKVRPRGQNRSSGLLPDIEDLEY